MQFFRTLQTYLGTICVRSAVGHTEHASTCMFQSGVDLVVKLLSVNRTSTSSCASRITCLDHEVWDDSMANDIIVVSSLHQGHEVSARFWRMVVVDF